MHPFSVKEAHYDSNIREHHKVIVKSVPLEIECWKFIEGKWQNVYLKDVYRDRAIHFYRKYRSVW